MASRLRNTVVNLRILGFTRSTSGNVIIQYELLLPRPYAPPDDDVTADFREGLLYIVGPEDDGNLRLSDTTIIVSREAIRGLTITGNLSFIIWSVSFSYRYVKVGQSKLIIVCVLCQLLR